MFLKRNILTKSQWMGITALIMAFIMVFNPVPVLAEEGGSDGTILFFSEDGTETVTGGGGTGSQTVSEGTGGSAEGRAAVIVDDEEIWALVDKEELRSKVDVDSIKSSIDELALLDSIDRDELRAGIDGAALLDMLFDEDLQEEFIERKLEGEYFVVDEETGKGLIVSEDEYKALKPEKEEETLDIENLSDSSFAEKIDEETRVLEDGRTVTSFRVKLPEQYMKEHPVDVTNIQLPVLGVDSPFDFIIDPLQLVYLTDAARYGGGRVEEGATVLFKNTEGDYDLSHKSDMLTVVNKSNVPVKLVVTAVVKDSDVVTMAGSTSELHGDQPSIFMALTDEDGIASVITGYGEAVIETVLKAAPDDTYEYTFNEKTGTYDYTLSRGADSTEYDSFNFGVIAACNTEADWDDIDARPAINVSWKVEPILTDWDDLNADLEAEKRAKLLEKEEEYEAFKLVKTDELIEDKLFELIEKKLTELKEDELERLIEEEMLILAYERYDEIRAEQEETGAPADSQPEESKESQKAQEVQEGQGTVEPANPQQTEESGNNSGDQSEQAGADEQAEVRGARREEEVTFDTSDSEESVLFFESGEE